MPQNSRMLEWEETAREESQREFFNSGPSLDAVESQKAYPDQPCPSPAPVLADAVCAFQTLLEEFGCASRGQARAFIKRLTETCPCPDLIWPSCARPKSMANVPTKGQRQYGTTAWDRCQHHPTAGMLLLPLTRAEFGRSFNSSELKRPHLQKGN